MFTLSNCRMENADKGSDLELSVSGEEVVLQYLDGFKNGRPERKTVVRAVQKQLVKLEYPLVVDGYYGNEMTSVIKRYQTDKNLPVGGEKTGKYVTRKIFQSIMGGASGADVIPAPENIGNGSTVDVFKYLTKSSKRDGMQNGFPVYWHTASHKSKYKVNYGNEKQFYRIYTDLWTIKEMKKTMDALASKGVVGINHIGSYNYRSIAGSANRSRHSYGLAFDVMGFYMADGSYLSVLKDWKKASKSKLLKSIRDVFCQHWDIVLSPDYNANHADHIHVDLDPRLRNTYETASPRWSSIPSSLPASLSLAEEFDPAEEEDAPEVSLHEEIDYDQLEAEMDADAFSLTANLVTRAHCR